MNKKNEDINKKLVALESILLVSDKALKIKDLIKKLNINKKEIKNLIIKLEKKFNHKNSGIHILNSHHKIQFTTNPNSREIVEDFIKEELNTNLSDPSLETLTIIAYRGPITKSELEQIRGVNCSVILKNLLIRDLIEVSLDKDKMSEVYSISLNFLKYLGLNKINELPEYDKLHKHELIDEILNQDEEKNIQLVEDSQKKIFNIT